MKMVSASKLKKAQDAILRLRPYSGKLLEVLSELGASLNHEVDSPYTEQRKIRRVLIVLISSNGGLCGAFNTNIAREAAELAEKHYGDRLAAGQVDFLAIGKQGETALKTRGIRVSTADHELLDKHGFTETMPAAEALMKKFRSGTYDRVELVYNQFKNAAVQLPVKERFLPVQLGTNEQDDDLPNADFIFEPSRQEIIRELIPRALKMQFYRALADSAAAEHGARMTAMHQATDNATELIRELTITFNKARQAAITNQIIEVTNGAETLR